MRISLIEMAMEQKMGMEMVFVSMWLQLYASKEFFGAQKFRFRKYQQRLGRYRAKCRLFEVKKLYNFEVRYI